MSTGVEDFGTTDGEETADEAARSEVYGLLAEQALTPDARLSRRRRFVALSVFLSCMSSVLLGTTKGAPLFSFFSFLSCPSLLCVGE